METRQDSASRVGLGHRNKGRGTLTLEEACLPLHLILVETVPRHCHRRHYSLLCKARGQAGRKIRRDLESGPGLAEDIFGPCGRSGADDDWAARDVAHAPRIVPCTCPSEATPLRSGEGRAMDGDFAIVPHFGRIGDPGTMQNFLEISCAAAPSSAQAERPRTARQAPRHAQTGAGEAVAPNPREETHSIRTRLFTLCTFPRQALVHMGNYPTWHRIRQILVACKAQSGTRTPVGLLLVPTARRIPRLPHSECSNEALVS
jgi:hypothetical protein